MLDNFEQVIAAAPACSATCCGPGRTCALVATSRAPLHVYGEQEYPVPPLACPIPAHLPPLEALTQYEAVALFIERAMAAKPDFAVTNENAPAVAEITARLDGLPLAIELAAARVKLLTPQAMLPRLESRLALLARRRARPAGAPADAARRHRLELRPARRARPLPLRAGVGLRRRLRPRGGRGHLRPSTAGGAALDVLDGLGALADQSLVRQVEEHGHVRFRMLETIREFATERLVERGEADELRRRHATWFTELVERAAPHLTGQDRARWLDIVEHDHDNVRAALAWAQAVGDTATALRIVWSDLALLAEPGLPDRGPDACRVRAGHARPTASIRSSSCAATRPPAASPTGAATSRPAATTTASPSSSPEPSATASSSPTSSTTTRSASSPPTRTTTRAGRPRRRPRDLPRAGRRGGPDQRPLGHRATRTSSREDWVRSAESYTEALALARATGNDFMVNWSLHMLGASVTMLGQFGEAHRYLTEGTEAMVRAGEMTGLVIVLDDWVDYDFFTGDYERAIRLYGAARHLQEQTSTGLAEWSNMTIRGGGRDYPGIDAETQRPPEAEGAALPLDEAIALALGRPSCLIDRRSRHPVSPPR